MEMPDKTKLFVCLIPGVGTADSPPIRPDRSGRAAEAEVAMFKQPGDKTGRLGHVMAVGGTQHRQTIR